MNNKQLEYWKIRTTNPRFQPLAVKNLNAIKINPDVSDIEIIRLLDYWTKDDSNKQNDDVDRKRPIEKFENDNDDELNRILSPKHPKLPASEMKSVMYQVNYGIHVPSRKSKKWKYDGFLRVESNSLYTLYNEDKKLLTSIRIYKPIDIDEEFILGNYDCRISSPVEDFVLKK